MQSLSKLLVPLTKGSAAPRTSVDLLSAHGFVHQVGSGVYDLLPLGLRVQRNITRIVQEELNRRGCTELELSTMVNPALWLTTGRLQQSDLDAAESRANEFTFTEHRKQLLAPTGEEQITSLVGSRSYRQLPLSLYQVTRKFRNELRPRGGLLRTREFLMKDLYTFDATPELAHASYARITAAYNAIFERIGVPFVCAAADSGTMGGDLSHEYHMLSESGEDRVFVCKNCAHAANEEVADASAAENGCPSCGSALELCPAIEVGHTFYLGDRYSRPLKALVTARNGESAPISMGCYGIGVTRIIAAVAEVTMDAHGLVWPASIAPFRCIVVAKDVARAETAAAVLAERGIDATYEDRTTQIGHAMRAAREIGAPYTLVLGNSYEKEGLVEILDRKSGEAVKCTLEEAAERMA